MTIKKSYITAELLGILVCVCGGSKSAKASEALGAKNQIPKCCHLPHGWLETALVFDYQRVSGFILIPPRWIFIDKHRTIIR